jgi:hypothetical protein
MPTGTIPFGTQGKSNVQYIYIPTGAAPDLFSLRRLSDASRHDPPAVGSSVLHRIRLQGVTREVAQAAGPAIPNVATRATNLPAAVPAAAGGPAPAAALGGASTPPPAAATTVFPSAVPSGQRAPSTPAVPSAGPSPVDTLPAHAPAQRSFAEVVRNQSWMPMGSTPSSPQHQGSTAPSQTASPARSVLDQAAATPLPDSSDSDRANDSGVPTPQVRSPGKASPGAGSAGTSVETSTAIGPQLVHHTNVPIVQLKASRSASLGNAAATTGLKPAAPVFSSSEVKSPVKPEALAPVSHQVDVESSPHAPKMERGEGSNSQAIPGETLPNLPKVRVTAPASPAAATPTTPTTPASRKAKRELAKIASDWPTFQADTSLERKSRRRSPTPVSPRSEAEDAGDPIGTLDLYGGDPDYDEAAEMAALDELLAPTPAPQETASVSEPDQPSSDWEDWEEYEPTDNPQEGGVHPEVTSDETPLAAVTPAAQPATGGAEALSKDSTQGATSWPAVDPKLFPSNGKSTIQQHNGGGFTPSAANAELHKQFFSRRPLLVDLKQDDPLTSLQLFDQGNTRSLLPKRVMIDSGARVFILISPTIATALGLTIEPGTAPIRGIGGSGGSLGATKEYINVRLGACELGEVNDDPCTGCFTLKVKAIVMTEEAVKSINHHVLLGQAFIRYCLGMTDPLTERFYYSPAWWTQACRDFRVSVPCTMSTPENAASVRNFLGVIDADNEDVAFVDPTIWSDSLKLLGTGNPAPELAAPLTTGFPQTEQVSAEQYATFRQEQKERNEEVRRVAKDTLAAAQAQAANELANIIEPTGVVFSLAKLKNSGRLLEGLRLDLSGASQTIMAQLSKLKESIIADVLKAVTGNGGGSAQAATPPPATAPTSAARPVNAVQVDPRDDLPYTVPVNWAAHGGGDIAPHNELLQPPPKSCLRASAAPFQAGRDKSGRKLRFGPSTTQTFAIAAAATLPAVAAAPSGVVAS